MLMYAYALPTPTFDDSPRTLFAAEFPDRRRIACGIAHPLSMVARVARPGTAIGICIFIIPHRRGLIIPDRYSLIYENGEEEREGSQDEIQGSRVLSLPLLFVGGCLSRLAVYRVSFIAGFC